MKLDGRYNGTNSSVCIDVIMASGRIDLLPDLS